MSITSTLRSAVRVTVVTIACAGTVLAGTAVASASAGPYDVTGDGVPDQYQVDTDGDGWVDNWWTDVDNDGTIDEFASDHDRNGWADSWTVDRDHDWVWDAVWIDTDGDGHGDALLGGYVYDTVWGPNSRWPALPVAPDCLTPAGGLPVDAPVYGDCSWLQSLGTHSGVGPDQIDVFLDVIDASSPGPL